MKWDSALRNLMAPRFVKKLLQGSVTGFCYETAESSPQEDAFLLDQLQCCPIVILSHEVPSWGFFLPSTFLSELRFKRMISPSRNIIQDSGLFFAVDYF
jgi:hypothetical protein